MNSLIGDRIKILRLKSNLTQEELAKQLGLSNGIISLYEKEERKPSLEVITQMCELFDCNMDCLMGLTSDIETTEILTDKKQTRLEQILDLANGLSIQEANYLIKQLNKSKIQIEKE